MTEATAPGVARMATAVGCVRPRRIASGAIVRRGISRGIGAERVTRRASPSISPLVTSNPTPTRRWVRGSAQGDERSGGASSSVEESDDIDAAAADVPDDLVRVAIAFAFPAIGGLLFGYDIGATSGALISLSDASTAGVAWGGSALSALRARGTATWTTAAATPKHVDAPTPPQARGPDVGPA